MGYPASLTFAAIPKLTEGFLYSEPITINVNGGDGLSSSTFNQSIQYIKWSHGSSEYTISESKITLDVQARKIIIKENTIIPTNKNVDIIIKYN